MGIEVNESTGIAVISDRCSNLCDFCAQRFAECMPQQIEFGEGIENDNVIECDAFIHN